MNEKINFKGSVMLNPVPVVLISSCNSKKQENVFTVAWAGTICTKPPMLSISIRPERLSYQYIKETMEFTVNIPSNELTYAVDYCGVKSGKTIDKIKEMNFTMKKGENVVSSYINECPISIECKVKDIIKLGTHDLFIAEVVGSHVNKSLLDEKGKIHFENANLITYCHGEYYNMGRKPLGKFGYSVSKNNIASKENNNKNSKEISNNNSNETKFINKNFKKNKSKKRR